MMPRIVARVAVAALAVGGLVALGAASHPDATGPSARSFDIQPPLPVSACPGPQTVPVGDVGTGGDLASEPTERNLQFLTGEATTPAGAGISIDAAIGAQMERTGNGDIEGWSAVTCTVPALEQWLVGGATSLGSSSRIVLTNPSGAPTEATVTVYGPLGQVDEQFVTAVAAGGQVDRLIESFAAELPTLVVRVTATGPGVVAVLQDSRLEGFQPAGTEWVGASDLATDVVIPALGLDVPDASVTVRLMAPEGAQVSLTLVSEDGIEPWSVGHAFELEPGVVTEVEVPAPDLAAIEVSADAPVVAAARTVVPREPREAIEGEVAYDHMWVAGEVVNDKGLTGVVPLTGARIALYSPTSGTVAFADAEGNVAATATVRARTVTWVDIDVPQGTTLSTRDAVAWAFVASSPDGYLAASRPVAIGESSLSATVVPAPYPAGT